MTITLETTTQLNRTLVNEGTAVWSSGNITSFSTGLGHFINQNSFTVTHGGTFSFAQFSNQADFVKTNSSSTVTFNSGHFTNAGMVTVETGTLELGGHGALPDPVDSGSYTAAPDALLHFANASRTLTNTASIDASEILVSFGSLHIYGGYTVTTTKMGSGGNLNWYGSDAYSLPVLEQNGGTIDGDAPLIIEQEYFWGSGHLNGTAPITITGDATLSLSLVSSAQLNRTIVNEGTAVWSSGNITSFSTGLGHFINQNSFTVTHGGTFGHFSFARFENQASFVKTGSQDAIRFDSGRFTNAGTVTVETGTLELGGHGALPDPVDSGSYTAAPDTLLHFFNVSRILTTGSTVEAHQVLVSSGSLAVQGSYEVVTTTLTGGTTLFNSGSSVTLPVLLQEGGFVDGADPLLITGTMLWTGGTLNGTAALTITEGATLTIDSASTRQINRELINEGVLHWLQGNINTFSIGLGSLINNGELIASHSSNTTANFLDFINNGRFTKTGSASQLTFNANPIAQNNGEIVLDSGTLRFTNGLDNYANNTLTGGTYVLSGTLQIENADIHTNQADVSLNTAGAAILDTAATPADALANFVENGADGRFALRYGAAITLPHGFTNSGELIAGPQGFFTSDGFTQTDNGATVTIELAGQPASGLYGQIEAGPEGNLAGTFQVAYRDGFVPGEMDSYVVMRFLQRSGNFDAFAGLSIDGVQVVTVAVTPTTVVINGIGVDPPEQDFTLYLPLVLNP
jgi:hypothetical protein